MASRIIPGDFVVKDIALTSLLHTETTSLKLILSELNIYESIFKNTLSGNLTVTDTENLISSFPIVGHESVVVIFGNPTDDSVDDIEIMFRIYKISPYARSGERSSEYTLQFISPEYYVNLTEKISRSFSSSKISDIVSVISREYLGVNADIETTKGDHSIIIPNWSPFETLNWLTTRAQNPTSDGSNYVFYEDVDGYKFKSVESLMNEDPIDKYVWRPRNLEEVGREGVMPEDDYLVPIDYTVDNHFDIIRNIATGMYANKVLTHDIVKRTYKEYTFDYLDTWDNQTHVTDNATISKKANEFTGIENSYIKFIPIHSNENSNRVENTILSRVSQMQQLNNFKINMTVPGNTGVRVGSMVELELPSLSMTPAGRSPTDWLYSGKFLISSLRHFIDGETHEMILELIKDSFDNTLPE